MSNNCEKFTLAITTELFILLLLATTNSRVGHLHWGSGVQTTAKKATESDYGGTEFTQSWITVIYNMQWQKSWDIMTILIKDSLRGRGHWWKPLWGTVVKLVNTIRTKSWATFPHHGCKMMPLKHTACVVFLDFIGLFFCHPSHPSMWVKCGRF